jgi:hypothetical protein
VDSILDRGRNVQTGSSAHAAAVEWIAGLFLL